MIQSNIYKSITTTLKWNAVESILYSSSMLIHQTLLFYIMNTTLYGTAGSLFSFIFLSEYTLCFGLNDITGTFYTTWSASRHNFLRFFGINLLINYVALIPYCIIFVSITQRNQHWSSLSYTLYALVILIILLEKTKRMGKTILHIIFRSKIKSLIELSTFGLYLLIVWSTYSMGISLDPFTLLMPMLFTSFIGCIALLIAVYHYGYYPLLNKTNTPAIDRHIWLRIIKSRFFAFGYKTGKRLLSGNFIVPIFAATFGMHHAGILKFTKQIAYYTTLILRKTFGTTSTVLFTHTRYDEGNLTHFHWIMRLLCYSMITIIAVSALATLCFRWYAPKICTLPITILMIACFIHAVTTHGITTLENWFIIHEKGPLLMVTQVILSSVWLLSLLHYTSLNATYLLCIATACNVGMFTMLTFFIAYSHSKNHTLIENSSQKKEIEC